MTRNDEIAIAEIEKTGRWSWDIYCYWPRDGGATYAWGAAFGSRRHAEAKARKVLRRWVASERRIVSRVEVFR